VSLLEQILVVILGKLGVMIVAFVRGLARGETVNQALVDAVDTIVGSVEATTLPLTGDEKRAGAAKAVHAWVADKGLTALKQSQVHTLIELAVQKLEADPVVA
jgi:hypothetical protein